LTSFLSSITIKSRTGLHPAYAVSVPVSVLAHVSINFVVKVSYSSPPLLLSVRKQP